MKSRMASPGKSRRGQTTRPDVTSDQSGEVERMERLRHRAVDVDVDDDLVAREPEVLSETVEQEQVHLVVDLAVVVSEDDLAVTLATAGEDLRHQLVVDLGVGWPGVRLDGLTLGPLQVEIEAGDDDLAELVGSRIVDDVAHESEVLVSRDVRALVHEHGNHIGHVFFSEELRSGWCVDLTIYIIA